MMLRYIDELEKILDKYGIAKEDVCLVNSAVLAVKNIRENGDLEFALRPSVREDIVNRTENFYYYNKYSEVIKFSENIDCDYNLYRMFNIYDEDLFQDTYTEKYGAYRVINPEVLMASKIIWNREKDEAHQKIIKESSLWSEDFEKKANAYVRTAIENGWPEPVDRNILWNNILASEKDVYIFGTGYIGRHVYKRFVREGMTDRLQGFVVSDRQEGQCMLLDKHIYELSEINQQTSLIVAATGIQSLKENVEMLRDKGFHNTAAGYALYVG